jgi:hypothetical protein
LSCLGQKPLTISPPPFCSTGGDGNPEGGARTDITMPGSSHSVHVVSGTYTGFSGQSAGRCSGEALGIMRNACYDLDRTFSKRVACLKLKTTIP